MGTNSHECFRHGFHRFPRIESVLIRAIRVKAVLNSLYNDEGSCIFSKKFARRHFPRRADGPSSAADRLQSRVASFPTSLDLAKRCERRTARAPMRLRLRRSRFIGVHSWFPFPSLARKHSQFHGPDLPSSSCAVAAATRPRRRRAAMPHTGGFCTGRTEAPPESAGPR